MVLSRIRTQSPSEDKAPMLLKGASGRKVPVYALLKTIEVEAPTMLVVMLIELVT